jgi:aconitate hydratase
MNQIVLSTEDSYQITDLHAFAGKKMTRLPFTMRILLENVLRNSTTGEELNHPSAAILNWQPNASQRPAVPFMPSRVLLQDLTGVPLLVDLAAMRSEKARQGADPQTITPRLPVHLVIDHSIQVDFNQHPDSLDRNKTLEYQRNHERYQFLRWAQDAFDQFQVVPPGKGIVHQVNLEYLASVVTQRTENGSHLAFPDTVFGTDSHTPMINGLGVLGWGVGGIEAIAAMLGKPTQLVLPDVIGLTFHGKLPEGSTPTDLTLTIVERLRREGVVGKFVECFGENLAEIPLTDRAMIANMSPESGATVIYFPVDDETLAFLELTGRSPQQVELVEHYCKQQGLFREKNTPQPQYSKIIEIDLTAVKPSLAGPFRPQDRVEIPDLQGLFKESLSQSRDEKGFKLSSEKLEDEVTIILEGNPIKLRHGSLLIAAITSCTNTSNPRVMLAAGLLAKKAVERGLRVSSAVKCSLMPGSQVVTAYLEKAGLLTPLALLGFNLTGYGCGTCIGNSGPLAPEINAAVKEHSLITASILSGNRNFEGRIHPLTKASFLASPPLVVAYALAGRIDIDLTAEPLMTDHNGNPAWFIDLYPTESEVESLIKEIQPELYQSVYANLFKGDQAWDSIKSAQPSLLYTWDEQSTYITEPPYFQNKLPQNEDAASGNILGARVLALLGHSITTDHISPAGSIPRSSPAGEYLLSLGVEEKDFNSFGARRGNDRIMVRGTFYNIRLKNALAQGKEGGYTRHFPDGELMTIYEAAQKYAQEQVPLIVIAGREYGTGSSRDWAAKGALLLGVKAIIAESFERIHRSNLVGMGILPLEFAPGENAHTLGLTGEERYDLLGLDQLKINGNCQVRASREDAECVIFNTTVRTETENELTSFLAGGILYEALL